MGKRKAPTINDVTNNTDKTNRISQHFIYDVKKLVENGMSHNDIIEEVKDHPYAPPTRKMLQSVVKTLEKMWSKTKEQ